MVKTGLTHKIFFGIIIIYSRVKEEGGPLQEQTQLTYPIKLDFSIASPQERNQLVKKIIKVTPPQKLTRKYLEILADYIVLAMTKEEKKEKKINTENRMATINRREISFEGLVSKFENGEDGIYNFITEDKNIIFIPKISITEQDLEEIPPLRQLREAIEVVQHEVNTARGKRRYNLMKQLIEMRQDQYVIKNAFKQPIYYSNATHTFNTMRFEECIKVQSDGTIKDSSLLSFFNPKHLSALLCNYATLKEDCYGKFYTDGYFLMEDLDRLIENTLRDKYPLYYDLMIFKIDKKTNVQIQKLLEDKYGVKHTVEYLSSLWRNKIPKLLADQATKEYLEWYFTEKQKGKWKRCSRCNEIKLAHNKFFSRNNSSKDGFYSICKCCRNEQTKKDKKPKIIKRIPYRREKEDGAEGL